LISTIEYRAAADEKKHHAAPKQTAAAQAPVVDDLPF